MLKKLKSWIYKKFSNDYVKVHKTHLKCLENTIKIQQNQINNLQQRLMYYNNKGAI